MPVHRVGACAHWNRRNSALGSGFYAEGVTLLIAQGRRAAAHPGSRPRAMTLPCKGCTHLARAGGKPAPTVHDSQAARNLLQALYSFDGTGSSNSKFANDFFVSSGVSNSSVLMSLWASSESWLKHRQTSS